MTAFRFVSCSARGRPGTRPVPPAAAEPDGSRVAHCQGAHTLGGSDEGARVEPRGFEPRTSAVQGRRSPG